MDRISKLAEAYLQSYYTHGYSDPSSDVYFCANLSGIRWMGIQILEYI